MRTRDLRRLNRKWAWALLAAPLAAAPIVALAQEPEPMPDAGEPPPPPPQIKLPAKSYDQARADPRFVRMALQDDARVRIFRTLDAYPYYGITNNGCSQGKHFFEAELLSPVDGLAAGTRVVLRIEDVTLGPTSTGATLAFSGMRRAGKGPDGTWVYCGRGSAFQIRAN
jgi:hypothetical protein